MNVNCGMLLYNGMRTNDFSGVDSMDKDFRTLPGYVADQIKEMIFREDLSIGAKLPSETELARLFQVSRNTIRAAARMLSEQNIVEIRQGSGTFVSSYVELEKDPLGLSLIHDKRRLVMDFVQIRLLVEPKMASLAAQNALQEESEQLSRICSAAEESFEKYGHYENFDFEFHSGIWNMSRNLVMHNLIPSLRQALVLQEEMYGASLGRQSLDDHRSIADAIKSGKGSDAHDAMLTHLAANYKRITRQGTNTSNL